jgi:hypothetical protein
MNQAALRCRFTVRTRTAQQPITDEEHAIVERILARRVARAYVADHPDFFGRSTHLPCAARPASEAKALPAEGGAGGEDMA